MKNRNTSVNVDERENRLVKKDFIYVVTLNLILFGLMIGLYFWNHSSGQLDRIFANLIHF
ncbi:MAG: hypothetical protein KW793_00215 [Candidatus Doudnabacteria bacterium]|nr:hypothetical protein [Candidatus Doudnabacteria bacterium]